MTFLPGFHLHLVEIGDQLHLQMSYTYPHSSLRAMSSDNGSFTLQAETCSDCRMTSRRLVGTSPVWPLPMGLTEAGLQPLSFRLCDPSAVELLEISGLLKRNSS